MARKTLAVLKNGNRDFNNVLDSAYNISDGTGLPFRFTSATTITANAALALNS